MWTKKSFQLLRFYPTNCVYAHCAEEFKWYSIEFFNLIFMYINDNALDGFLYMAELLCAHLIKKKN